MEMSHSQGPNSSHMCCFNPFSTHWATIAACLLKHQHNARPSRGETDTESADTTPGIDGVGI